MSNKKEINIKYLQNLVKEAVVSNREKEKNEFDPFQSEPEADISSENNNVDLDLQIFVDSLLSVNEKASISALESLIATGEDLEDIYYAAVDRMHDIYATGGLVSEQNDDAQRKLESSSAMMIILAQNLIKQGREEEGHKVLRLAEQAMSAGEAELGLHIISKARFNLAPDKITLIDTKFPEPIEAGIGPRFIQLLRLLPKVFKKGRDLLKSPKSTKLPKPKKNNIKQRSTRQKNRQKRRESKYGPKQRPFRRNQRPAKAPKPPKRVSRLKQLAAVLGVAFIDELMAPLSALVEDFGKIMQNIHLESAYSGSHMQYALENFEGEQTETVNYKEAAMFFGLFSRVDYETSNCIPDALAAVRGISLENQELCSNITRNPLIYTLPIQLEENLKNLKNSPEIMFKDANAVSKGNAEAFFKIYVAYKNLFKDSGVTEYVVDNLLFISVTSAKYFARAAAQAKISPAHYIAYCIKPIIFQDLNYDIRNKNLENQEVWSEVVNIDYIDEEEFEEGLIEKLESYKEEFSNKYFSERSEFAPPNSSDEISVKDVRLHFEVLASATQTHMTRERGGYDSIMNCIKSDSKDLKSPEDYALQSRKIKMFVSLFGGGYLDGKILELITKAVKKKYRPSAGGLWSNVLRFWPVIEIGFYFIDPANIYDRRQIRLSFDEIKQIIDDEAKHFANEEKWFMRKEKVELIERKIDSIFDEIMRELNTSIDRFYDVVRTDETLCQQLDDKLEMRKATRDLTLRFKQAISQGFKDSLFNRGMIDSARLKNPKLNSFIITNENWKSVSDSIPIIQDEINELHRQIAVPETGLFMQADMKSPEEFIKVLRNPKAAKEAAEAAEKAKKKEKAKDYMPGGSKWNPLREETTKKRGDNYLLFKGDVSQYVTDVPGLMENLSKDTYTDEERIILKSIAIAFNIKDIRDIKYLKQRISNLASLAGIDFSGDLVTGDSSVRKMITPFGDTDFDLSKSKIKQIIEEGYKDYKRATASSSLYYKKTGAAPLGCVIRFPSERKSSGGIFNSDNNPLGGFIISNPSRAISAKIMNLGNRPFFSVFKQNINITSVGDLHVKNMMQIYELLGSPIDAKKKYKVIYNPEYCHVVTGKPCGEMLLNKSLISPNRKQDYPVVDILLEETGSTDKVDFNMFRKSFLDSIRSSGAAVTDTNPLSEKIDNIITKTMNYKSQILSLNNTDKQSVITATGGNDSLLKDNIGIGNIVINLLRSLKTVIAVINSAKNNIIPIVNTSLKQLFDKYSKYDDKMISSLNEIEQLIRSIKPLYFARPSGYRGFYGGERDSRGMLQISTDPAKRSQRVEEIARSMRCMHEKNVENIIKTNYSAYQKILEIANDRKKIKSKENIITGNVNEDIKTLEPVIRSMYLLYNHHKVLSDNGFDFLRFLKEIGAVK